MSVSHPHIASSKNHRRERLQSIGHYLTAFVLALEGVSKLEHADGFWAFIILCWFCSAAIVVLTLFHRQVQRHFPASQALIHLSEAAVCAGLVYVTHHEGKVGLPYAWLVAAILLGGLGLFELARLRNAR